MLIRCKSCGNVDKNYAGYCQKCYTYFIKNKYEEYKDKIEYGKVSIVKENNKQKGMVICNICGKAFTKLQSHIYYVHRMSKNEYCDHFGLDRNARLTADGYNKKMRDYAYKYHMDEQVVRVGKKTRFQKGRNNNYVRSYMTQQRLKHCGNNNLKYKKEE